MRQASGERKLWVLLGLCCVGLACRDNKRPARRADAGVVRPARVGPADAATPPTDAPGERPPAATPCPGGILCDGRCVDPQTDVANCGGCGRACTSSSVCAAGVCGSDAGPAACAEGQTRCGPYCATVAIDPLHCGRCGNRCAPGQICAAGQCAAAGPGLGTPAATGCTPPSVRCGAYCVATSTDPLNCGGCGTRCAPGQLCAEGRCVESVARRDGGLAADPARCAAPQVACGAYCANPANDPFNCGGCGARCAPNQVCAEGRCAVVGPPFDAGTAGARAGAPPPR